MIFNHVNFLNESVSSENKAGFELGRNIISESGVLIKNCDFVISEEFISECAYDTTLIEETALLEGAKLDLKLKNFMQEGEDYKGLKKELRKVIDANNLSDEKLKSGKNDFMHICKRILQCCEDILAVFSTFHTAGYTAAGIALGLATGQPTLILCAVVPHIIGFVIGFIINRLFRLLWDTIEFETIKKDAESIVKDLRKSAEKAPKLEKKLNAEADRLEAAIEKYSNKRKNKEKKDD